MTRRHHSTLDVGGGGGEDLSSFLPDSSGRSGAAAAAPSSFDYEAFSKFVVSATPGKMTPKDRLSTLRQQHGGNSYSAVKAEMEYIDCYGGYSTMAKDRNLRRRELVAWVVVILQACLIGALFFLPTSGGRRRDFVHSATMMNDKLPSYYENRRVGVSAGSIPNGGFVDGIPNPAGVYSQPIFHPISEPALAERQWHSLGSPSINKDLKQGTCWCSADEWCMCTPSLAIDVVLKSGPDHVWLVRRADTGLLALMGGMNEVGETADDAVHRELAEEMNIVLPETSPPVLFGVYNDPRRDTRRHTASVAYIVDVPDDMEPRAGDDATEVVRLPLSEVEQNEFFVDHKTILRDFVKVANRMATGNGPLPTSGDGEPFRRSVCPML